MSGRRVGNVTRGAAVTLLVDGEPLASFAGETIAAAMLANGCIAFRRDTHGQARGLFCNMGSCGECTVTLTAVDRRVRACLTPVADRMEVSTRG